MFKIEDDKLRQTIQKAINKTLLTICKKPERVKIWYSEDTNEKNQAHWIIRIVKQWGANDNPKANVHEWTKEARKQLKRIGATNFVTTETRNSTVNYIVFDLIELKVNKQNKQKDSKENA